ncbi:hypothetical protein TRAPUB_11044 [Trametes pubescens]|uniref:Uncharacterized protein n=1 Tax=Trametes pubescens TaxID=154538 RepID=A0A1M2VXY5_TRAPU|nr:hypothetical protein TRAPUB_11044 [Trametes pubescens]
MRQDTPKTTTRAHDRSVYWQSRTSKVLQALGDGAQNHYSIAVFLRPPEMQTCQAPMRLLK